MTELQMAEMAHEIKTGGDLAQLKSIPPLEIFDQEKLPLLLKQIREIVIADAIGLDSAETEAQRNEIKSLAYKVARVKNEMKRIAGAATDGWKKKIAEVNKLDKKAWDELQRLQDDVRHPLTLWEKAEQERKQGQLDRIADLTRVQLELSRDWDMMTVDSMRERLSDIHKDYASHYWGEFKVEGEKAYKNAVSEFDLAIQRKIKLEAERRELESLRKEREKIVQIGQKNDPAPIQNVTPADQKMEEVRQKNRLMMSDFISAGLDQDAAKKAVTAIYQGKIRFIKLEY